MNSLVIKVWDLLRNPGRVDTVSFEGIMIDDFEGLTSSGISATLLLQWVNDGSVKIVIKNLKAMIQDTCDLSGEDYEREVYVTDKHITYSATKLTDLWEDSSLYDDTLPRDGEHEMIDLKDGLCQIIQLEAPLVSIKPGNEYILDQFESWDDE
jgi:hypothetical protein